jgi:hypothetical protein
MMSEATKRSLNVHRWLKLGAVAIASIAVAGVLGALLILAGIQIGYLTPPMGEYRLGPLEVISLRDRQACLPNQVCADGVYMLYLGIRTVDNTSLGLPIIHGPRQ